MNKKNFYIVVDTETANGYLSDKGKLCLDDSLVYDIGWSICDKKGNIYKTVSLVISETFNNKDLMNSAYYADKLPQYYDGIVNRTRRVVNIMQAKSMFERDCREYNVKAICAHNARFDLNALNTTIRYYTKSKCRYFFPYGIEIWDTLKMCDVIAKQKCYKRFCEENGYMTKHKTPRVRKTAEILYRYITFNNDFIENHTGLEDTKIEVAILAHCFRQHKKMRKLLFEPKTA